MAEPEISWSHPDRVTDAPPMRWVRWVAALLILLTMALLSHTSGRFARQAMVAARHWMTQSTVLPAGVRTFDNGAISKTLSHLPLVSSSRLSAPSAPAWLPPVNKARLKTGFGWHGKGASAQFASEVVLNVAPGSAVMTGLKGRVSKIHNHLVTIQGSSGIILRLSPLEGIRVRTGQTVVPTQRLGGVAGSQFSIAVTKDGYPVNPLAAQFFGTAWITP